MNSRDTHKQQRMVIWTGKVFMVEVALLVLLSSSATAQWDPATGHVKPVPTSGPPFFDPAPWNGAYKVTFRSVPIIKSTAGLPEWPYAPVRGVDTTQECSTDGFDTTPASTVDMVRLLALTWHASLALQSPHNDQGHAGVPSLNLSGSHFWCALSVFRHCQPLCCREPAFTRITLMARLTSGARRGHWPSPAPTATATH
jgi:hypothetical protein